ncbi:MAG: putative DNA-binding domain-containing protein [Opitutaceae bacterium]|nr:putative DNA-binding domain-containing protein [Opitutaceae bacterium]
MSAKPMPSRAPERIRSAADLRAFQRLMLQAVIRPLGPGYRSRRRWPDGRPATVVIDTFAAPNPRLSGFERIEIYNRMYWFRTLDSLHEDLPGLRAVLGERRFMRLIEAYLVRHPSRSFTLRDLPARLEAFIRRTSRLTAPHTALAADMAAFEWAQVECFDAAALPPLTPADVTGVPGSRLRLSLQPHVRLLALRYPVDEFALAVKDAALRGDASNAVVASRRRLSRRVRRPRAAPTWLAVHRHEGKIYYKRLDAPAHRILTALRSGRTLTQAVATAGRGVQPDQVRAWFTTWMHLGWFCRR